MHRWRSCLLVLLLASLMAPTSAWADGDTKPTEAQVKEAAELEKLFVQIGTYASRDDRPALAELFDAPAVLATLEAGGFTKRLKPDQLDAFRREITVGLPTILASRQIIAPFANFEILRVINGEGQRRLVLVRHRDLDGWITNIRWWVVRRGSEWRIYDYEDMDVAMRFSSLTGTAAIGRVTGRKDFREAVTALQAGVGLIAQQLHEDAWRALQKADQRSLPRILEANRQLLLGMVHLHLDQHLQAMQRFADAERLNKDLPILDRLRAVSLNRRRQHADALKYAQRYTKRLGTDAIVQLEVGRAHKGLGDNEAAIAAFMIGLDDHPEEPELIAELAMALPPAEKPAAVAHFREMHDPVRYFEYIAEHVHTARDANTLRLFNRAFAAMEPGHPVVDYYEARALAIEGKQQQAIDLFKRAMDRVKNPELLRPYVEAYLDAMLNARKEVEGLAGSPDPRFAFSYMAWDLSQGEQTERLAALVAAARKSIDKATLETRFFEIEVQYLREQYDQILRPLAQLRLDTLEVVDKERRRRDAWELLWEMEDRLIRSLLRTQRLPYAEQYAKQIEGRDDDPLYRGLVAAKQGKHNEAADFLRRALGMRLDPGMIFEDEDIADILKGAAYAPLRREFWKR